jgi:hypothetical protein
MNWKSAVVVAVVILLAGCGTNFQPGTGEKIGQIVKLKQEGIFSKTWEAELIRGGMNSGSGSFGVQPFDFTIEDAATAQRIEKYLHDQTEVVITYRTEGVYACTRSGQGGGDFLVTIRPSAEPR